MGGRNIDVGGVQPMVNSTDGVYTVVSNEAVVDVIPSHLPGAGHRPPRRTAG